MQIFKYWKTLTSVATGIIAIAGAFVILDIEFPRPAWASEVKVLSNYVSEVDSIITSQQLDDTRLRLYQNEREQNKYRRDNQVIPQYLIEERVLIERQIDNLQIRLHRLREKD